MPMGVYPRRPREERFWPKVEPEPNSGCWLWNGAVDKRGYGRLGRTLAHRISYEIAYGRPGRGLYVCHTCDVPGCVRPDHLFLGTQSDNIRDAATKGRIANSRKTHCRAGHPYSKENTYAIGARKHRVCRTCHGEHMRRWYRALELRKEA